MTKTRLKEWLEESVDHQRAFAEEALILDVTENIWALMDERNVTKAELADRLGRSKAFVTQVLNGSRNMTLRTLADIAFALDAEPRFSLVDQGGSDGGWVDNGEASFGPRLMARVPTMDAANMDWVDLGVSEA